MNVAFAMHRELGPGLLESVYESILKHELERLGFKVEQQVAVPIQYRGMRFERGFRADLIIDSSVILEIKSVEQLLPVHGKQLLTYLRLTGCRLGLLINFGEELLKHGFKRIANGMPS